MIKIGVGPVLLCGAILSMVAFQGVSSANTFVKKSHVIKKHSDNQSFNLHHLESIATLAPVLNTVESMPKLLISRTFSCKLTAYGPGYESTGKRPGDPGYMVTASGKIATPKRTIAVDPQLIPLGSLVYIEGVGYRIAEDIGGAVKGQHIDVYFPSDQQAVQFGVKKHVKVFVFKKDRITVKY